MFRRLFPLLFTLPLTAADVTTVFEHVENHDFHPVRKGFTYDRQLDKHGVADLADPDWKVRTLAVRDLVRTDDLRPLLSGLVHDDPEGRYLAAMALGIRKQATATPTLAKLLATDPHSTVRSQAAIALGQIGDDSALPALRRALDDDKDRDVTHQATLAIHAIESDQPATHALAEAWRTLDPATFAIARVGEPAPDFTLTDTEGQAWKLSDFRGKKAVALINKQGTYWGDRPTIHEVLEMMKTGNYDYPAPKRLKPAP